MTVYKTGGGKTHIVRTIGVIEKGIVLIFIPLLTLSADVLTKFIDSNKNYGTITVQHLDELRENNFSKYQKFLQTCEDMQRSTTSTIFVFLSPQFLVNHDDARQVFIRASHRRTVRVIVMDEIHLQVQHGESFREECRELADVFFKEVFQHPNYPNIGIRFLGTTATLPTRYVPAIERLTTLNFTPSSIYRGSPVDFEQREIEMTLQICSVGGYVNIALTSAVEYLTTDTRKGKLVIFTNSAYKSFHYLKELEKKLNLKGGGLGGYHTYHWRATQDRKEWENWIIL